MENLIHSGYIICLLGFIVWCCYVFTNAVEHMGKAYNLNDGAVGSILAAVGTALPETIVPLVAILGAVYAGKDIAVGAEIGIGAILGAPFLLITLAMFVSGLAVIIFSKMKLRSEKMNANPVVMLRDLKFFFISYSVAIFSSFIPNMTIKHCMAILLLVLYLIYVIKTVRCCHSGEECAEENSIAPLFVGRLWKQKFYIFSIWLQVALSIGLLIFCAHLFVEQIKFFAHTLNFNPLILSLILAPIATELPEKFNSVIWIRSSKDTLALGNITGAMVFQSCIPTAVGIALTPWVFETVSFINILLVYISATILYFNILKDKAEIHPNILLTCGLFYFVYLGYILSTVIK